MRPEIPLLGRALLALLRQAPLSGYDIRRMFTQTPMGTFSDSPGAIYPALKRLEAQGLIRGRVERSAGLRQRKIFQLTATGTSSLEAWLNAPLTRDDVIHGHEELMLRFGFMDGTVGEAASVRFLQALQKELGGYIQELQTYLKSHGEEMPRSGRLALAFGIQSYETLLHWTRQALLAYREHPKGGRRS